MACPQMCEASVERLGMAVDLVMEIALRLGVGSVRLIVKLRDSVQWERDRLVRKQEKRD